MNKKCKSCGIIKPIEEFTRDAKSPDGKRYSCRVCRSKETCLYQKKNSQKVNAKNRAWRRANPEKAKEAVLRWQKDNPEKVNAKSYAWRRANPGKCRAIQKRSNKKTRSTVQGKLNSRLASSIWDCLRRKKNNRRWELLVGYTVKQLKTHLEKQFKPGMSWENYGTYWHIDHIVPKSVFNYQSSDDIDFQQCWSLNNLQPLEAEINFSKGAKLVKPFQPSLAIRPIKRTA